MESYAATAEDSSGFRRHVYRIANGGISDEVRSLAQGFATGSRAVFVAACGDPPSLLLAVSADSGLHAGELMKRALSLVGGRGGGNAQLAQGSVPTVAALEEALAVLLAGM